MTLSNQNWDHAHINDHADRLMDVALAELVGGKSPPDLTSRMLPDQIQPLANSPKRYRTPTKLGFWVSFAAAAMLFAAATLALLPDFRNAREVKHTFAQERGIQNQHPAAERPASGATTPAPATPSHNI